jgi:hypothetical protein
MILTKIEDMKKTILILSVSLVFVFVACKQKSAQTDLNNYPDTAAYNYPVNDYKTQPSTTYSGTYNKRATKPVYHKTRYTSSSSYAAYTTTRKKGWSGAAKGAVIGAGSGAVLGAVVSGDHHRVKGAVIGGAVGAAGGYLYGRHRDKKYRRY